MRAVSVVGIAGHRSFPNSAALRRTARRCRAVLEQLLAGSAQCRVLSPLAEGADTVFAEVALRLGMRLDVVRPYRGFGGDFATEKARARYRRLCAAATSIDELPFDVASDSAFESAMNQVVQQSDLLVVAWDGRLAGGCGGTAHSVRRVIELGRPWIHVDTTSGRVRLYGGRDAIASLTFDSMAEVVDA